MRSGEKTPRQRNLRAAKAWRKDQTTKQKQQKINHRKRRPKPKPRIKLDNGKTTEPYDNHTALTTHAEIAKLHHGPRERAVNRSSQQEDR